MSHCVRHDATPFEKKGLVGGAAQPPRADQSLNTTGACHVERSETSTHFVIGNAVRNLKATI